MDTRIFYERNKSRLNSNLVQPNDTFFAAEELSFWPKKTPLCNKQMYQSFITKGFFNYSVTEHHNFLRKKAAMF